MGYWLCQAYDDQGHMWYSFSAFRTKAIKKAQYDCLNKSQAPKTCSVNATDDCLRHSHSHTPYWDCKAYDNENQVWQRIAPGMRLNAMGQALTACHEFSHAAASCKIEEQYCKRIRG